MYFKSRQACQSITICLEYGSKYLLLEDTCSIQGYVQANLTHKLQTFLVYVSSLQTRGITASTDD